MKRSVQIALASDGSATHRTIGGTERDVDPSVGGYPVGRPSTPRASPGAPEAGPPGGRIPRWPGLRVPVRLRQASWLPTWRLMCSLRFVAMWTSPAIEARNRTAATRKATVAAWLARSPKMLKP